MFDEHTFLFSVQKIGISYKVKKEADDTTYLLVAHNGIARFMQSYFYDMSNEEFAMFGIKNCEIRRYDF